MGRLFQLLYQVVDGYGGHAQYLDGAPAAEDLDADGLDLLVDLLDALRLALQSLLSIGCQR
jgi:hypothetical protein